MMFPLQVVRDMHASVLLNPCYSLGDTDDMQVRGSAMPICLIWFAVDVKSATCPHLLTCFVRNQGSNLLI
jgi:hypothetical protein